MSRPTGRELAVSAGLFVATFACSSACYVFYRGETWDRGLAFAASLLGILLAHELGHYLVARAHGFELSLPYFLPVPLPLGTLGAVISLRSGPKSRQALLEMGAAGPLAGIVVAIGILFLGLPEIAVPPLPPSGTEVPIFRDPLLVKLIGLVVNGEVPDPLAEYGPVAWAGWVGCFLTGLNLIPIGQLDGGHVMNALSPRLSRLTASVLPVAFFVLGVLGLPDLVNSLHILPALPIPSYGWAGWLPWLAILGYFRGTDPLAAVPPEPPVPARSRAVAVVVLVVFILTFLPAPTWVWVAP